MAHRTAVVTGASRGIGRAIAEGFASSGVNVVLVARSAEPLQELVDEVEGQYDVDAVAIPGDVSDQAFRRRLVEDAWEWRGRIEVLVNAAGVTVRSEPPDVEEADWEYVQAVNVTAPFFLSQALGELMRQAGGGVITQVASVAAHFVTKAPISYQTSKAALVQSTRGLAKALAPTVRVNAVGPGYIETELNREWLSSVENRQYVLSRTPLGRVGSPEDVVAPVLFLSSDEASFITGQHLLIDGGWSVS